MPFDVLAVGADASASIVGDRRKKERGVEEPRKMEEWNATKKRRGLDPRCEVQSESVQFSFFLFCFHSFTYACREYFYFFVPV